jgi:two-component system response regulator PhoP
VRALIVEDDQSLRDQLARQMRHAGFAVDAASDGKEGLFQASEYPLDIAVIDLGLPNLSGIELIRKVRADGKQFPILILTARDGWQNKVEGLEAGADDYLVKPFQPEELLARVRALIRRTGGWAQPQLQCGPILLDASTQQVSLNGEPLNLTAYEYRLLEYLMMHAGEVVSKSTLTEHIYEEEIERDSNVIEVFIRRLRKKLDADETLHPIETLRGRGYRLTLPRNGGEQPQQQVAGLKN